MPISQKSMFPNHSFVSQGHRQEIGASQSFPTYVNHNNNTITVVDCYNHHSDNYHNNKPVIMNNLQPHVRFKNGPHPCPPSMGSTSSNIRGKPSHHHHRGGVGGGGGNRGSFTGRSGNRSGYQGVCFPHGGSNHPRPPPNFHQALPVPYASQSHHMSGYSPNQNPALYPSSPSTSSSLGSLNHFPNFHNHQPLHPQHPHHPVETSQHQTYHQHLPQSHQQPVYALTLYQPAPPSPAGSHHSHSGPNPTQRPNVGSLSHSSNRRSVVLEKIHQNQKHQIQLHDLNNHVCEFATDSLGSRFLQDRLASASLSEKTLLFKELLSSLYQMMTHPFGNYVIQKFLELGTPDQKHTLIQHMKGQVVNLITHTKATHVIQKAIESVTLNDQRVILEELSGQVVRCSRDGNACHTLQRIIDVCSTEITTEIVEDLIANTEILAEDQFGNYCIQELLEKGSPPCKSRISAKLLSSILPLARHKIANNVVQKCIKMGDTETISGMVIALKGHVVSLSTHPYGSRVIQCIIQNFNPGKCAPIIEEACQQIENLAQDSYGNFVLHQILEHGRLEDKTRLVQTVCDKAALLSRHRYANILVQKCLKQMDTQHMESMLLAFKGQIQSLAAHPHGCRVIQGLLECGDKNRICSVIFDELDDHLENLIQDEHSNYVVQQMLDQGRPEDRALVIEKISHNFIPLAQNKFSTNVVQKCLHTMNAPELQKVVDAISGHVFELTSHPYSVHVMQILFAIATQEMRFQIFSEMIEEDVLVSICQDQYGNYSMQHIIEHGTSEQRLTIAEQMVSRLYQLSSHKFASNVVTKALTFAEVAQRHSLIKHACNIPASQTSKGAVAGISNGPSTSAESLEASGGQENGDAKMMIVAMAEDPFANYVVQKMIEVSDDELLTLIVSTISPHAATLCKIPYAKGVLCKLPLANHNSA